MLVRSSTNYYTRTAFYLNFLPLAALSNVEPPSKTILQLLGPHGNNGTMNLRFNKMLNSQAANNSQIRKTDDYDSVWQDIPVVFKKDYKGKEKPPVYGAVVRRLPQLQVRVPQVELEP